MCVCGVVENKPCSDCTTPISIRCVLISFQSNTMIVKISLINFHFRDISLWSSFCFSSWFLLMLACVVWSVCVRVFGKKEKKIFFFINLPKHTRYLFTPKTKHTYDKMKNCILLISFSSSVHTFWFSIYIFFIFFAYSQKINWWHQSETLAHTCRRVDAWKNKSF